MDDKPDYGTWIRLQKILIFYFLSIFLILLFLITNIFVLRIALLLSALPFIYISFILSYTYYQFSSRGGNYQYKIHNVIVEKLAPKDDAEILDIGSGSGALLINLAKKYPNAKYTGIDYWGDDWEYSKKQCERNAQREGVDGQIKFIKSTASSLPFEAASYDYMVSCLTFHEVNDEPDKSKVIGEALRVLKPGGRFVFLDLFANTKVFGKIDELERKLKNDLGVADIQISGINKEINLPKLLLGKQSLGYAMIISGMKV